MFDIGFWEILMVLLVALIVLGPEQLTKSARIIGKMVGKMRANLDNIKKELDLE